MMLLHILLVIAMIVVLIRVIQGRRQLQQFETLPEQ